MTYLEKMIWAHAYINRLSGEDYNIEEAIKLADEVVIDIRAYLVRKNSLEESFHYSNILESERLEEMEYARAISNTDGISSSEGTNTQNGESE